MLVNLYLNYLYRVLGDDIYRYIMDIPPGKIILKNASSLNLFDHIHIAIWHRFLIDVFNPSLIDKDYALILPCSGIKPYRASATHRLADAIIKKSNLDKYIQIYVLSEPMIIVPRELDIYYPFANYDYPPKELDKVYREKFIEILAKVLPKLSKHRKIVAVLPKHHKSILLESIKRCCHDINLDVVDYGEKAFKSIKHGIEILRNEIFSN